MVGFLMVGVQVSACFVFCRMDIYVRRQFSGHGGTAIAGLPIIFERKLGQECPSYWNRNTRKHVLQPMLWFSFLPLPILFPSALYLQ